MYNLKPWGSFCLRATFGRIVQYKYCTVLDVFQGTLFDLADQDPV